MFAESVPKLIDNMQETQPTFMAAVRRVYEKAFVRIRANLDDERKKRFKRLMIDWSLKQGRRRTRRAKQGKRTGGWRLWLADKVVFGKVKATFGGRMRRFVSGGAPLASEIAEFFHDVGMDDVGIEEAAAHDADQRLWWVASEAGRRVGLALASSSPGDEMLTEYHVGLVPDARGRGLGQVLLHAFLKGGRDAGARTYVGSCAKGNRHTSRPSGRRSPASRRCTGATSPAAGTANRTSPARHAGSARAGTGTTGT